MDREGTLFWKRDEDSERIAESIRIQREEEDRNRRELLDYQLEKANDQHEETRIVFQFYLDNQTSFISRKLEDFDRRAAAEIRLHARKTHREMMAGFLGVMFLLWLWH